jgi:hypothetical protein
MLCSNFYRKRILRIIFLYKQGRFFCQNKIFAHSCVVLAVFKRVFFKAYLKLGDEFINFACIFSFFGYLFRNFFTFIVFYDSFVYFDIPLAYFVTKIRYKILRKFRSVRK